MLKIHGNFSVLKKGGKMNIYSIWDKKAHVALGPFFVRHEVDAIRRVQSAMSDPSTSLSKYPEDFSLRHLGIFDEETCIITPCNDQVVELSTLAGMANNKKMEVPNVNAKTA